MTKIKLFKSVNSDQTTLAIEFPSQEIRDIFLGQTNIKKLQSGYGQNDTEMNAIVSVDKTIVCIPAFQTSCQRLSVIFPSMEIKNRFIHILNLAESNLIDSNPDDRQLNINDRRILDTASHFHLECICPYFKHYCELRYTAQMIGQARRDCHSFFSQDKLPKELALKIGLAVCPSDAIEIEDKTRVINTHFNRLN